VDNCSTLEITRINEEAERLNNIIQAASDPNYRELTLMVEPGVLGAITEELASITSSKEETILPNDLSSTLGTIDSLIRYKIYMQHRDRYLRGFLPCT